MTRQRPVSTGGDFLARMAAGSHQRAARAAGGAAALEARARRLPPPPALQLSPQGFDLIAEVKRRSPSAGTLASASLQVAAQARQYVGGGVAALSVLTEPEEFAGSLAHLKEVAAAARPVPAMRKDFLVAPVQLMEARVSGAAGVLLIVAMLTDAELRRMIRLAHELGLFVLVEVFDGADVLRARRALAGTAPAAQGQACRTLLGVNCRDLRTLRVDFGRFAALAGSLPPDIPWVAESGVETPAQAARVADLGYRLALVGTALMRAADPAALARQLLAAGRASARP